jgi:hypothetical protein
MDISLYISDVTDTNFQRVDLFKDENIEINLTSKNISDISKIFAEFTQGFTVPASPNNNKIFTYWFDADVDSGLFNANKRINAYIEINSLPFKYGSIQLDACKLKSGQVSSYGLTFFNKVVNLSDLMGDLELKDLDLSSLDHSYSESSVTSAMYSDSIHSGDVYYPLINYQRDMNYGDSSDFDLIDATNKIEFTDFKPAIRLIKIIEAIETKFTVQFSRDFFDRSVFYNLFLACHKEVKGVDNTGQRLQIDFTDKGNLEDLPGVTVDLTDNFIICNDSYYSYLRLKIIPDAGYETVPYKIERLVNGEIKNTIDNLKGTKRLEFKTLNDSNEHSFFINTTQEFNFTTVLDVAYFTSSLNILTATFNPQTVVGNISIAKNMPALKLKDFFSSLINQFNLIIVPTSSNSFYVDTLDTWYDKGDTFDITKYVNIDEINIKRPDIKKLINFKYQEAGAIVGKGFLDSFGLGYGDLKAKFDELTAGSDLNIDVKFENLMFERLSNDTTDPKEFTNIQTGLSIDTKLEPYAGKPYVFYKNGTIDLVDPIYIGATTVNKLFHTATEDNFDFDQITNSLNFNSENSTYHNEEVLTSLYANFWQNYIADLYNSKTRVLNLKAKLPISILYKLSLNDKLIINKRKYKISNLKINLINGDADIEIFTDYSIPADTIANEIPLTVDRTDITVDTDSLTVDRISTYDPLYSFITNGISRTTYTATQAKEYFEVKVTANTTWTAVKIDTGDGVTWFDSNKYTGNKTQFVKVNVNANSGASRSGTLRYIIGGVNFDLIIIQ